MKEKLDTMKEIRNLLRKERINLLGAFGNRSTKVVKDANTYKRNPKHKGEKLED